MTKEQIIQGLYRGDSKAIKEAIKTLEQEPCDDAISKASVFEILGNLMSIPYDFDRQITEKDVSESMDEIRALPFVQSKQIECEDTISRADAVKVASGYCHPSNIAKELAKLPPVTPKPETAHWIKVPDEETFFCSKCNCRLDDEQTYLPLNFCPNCGRKMVEPQESEG